MQHVCSRCCCSIAFRSILGNCHCSKVLWAPSGCRLVDCVDFFVIVVCCWHRVLRWRCAVGPLEVDDRRVLLVLYCLVCELRFRCVIVSDSFECRLGGHRPPIEAVKMSIADDSSDISILLNRNASDATVKSRIKSRSRSASCHAEWDISDSDAVSTAKSYKKKKTVRTGQVNSVSPMDTSVSTDPSTLMPPPLAPVTALPVMNRFESLSDVGDIDENAEWRTATGNKRRARKPKTTATSTTTANVSSVHTRPLKPPARPAGPKAPAITVTAPPSKELYSLVETVSKNHTYLARESELKIFPASADDHRRIVKSLVESEVSFFTHPVKDEARFRSVLYGIPHLPIETIREQLAAHKVVPVSIEYLLSREEREKNVQVASLANHEFNRLRSYVLEFSSAAVKRDDVHSVRFINRHVCKWRPFKSGGAGPTLCNRCCMFGHGQRSCGRSPVCSLCAQAHPASVCPLASMDNSKTKFCCINCVSNKLNAHHRASDPGCPSRELFMARRKAANEARSRGPTAKSYSAKKARSVLPPSRAPVSPQPRPSDRRSGPTSATSRPTSATPLNSQSYADAIRGPKIRKSAPANSDLFTLEECSLILFEAIEDLQNCHSKLDQLKVITKLLQKCLV